MQKVYFSCLDLSPKTQLLVYLGCPLSHLTQLGFSQAFQTTFFQWFMQEGPLTPDCLGKLLLFSLTWCLGRRASPLVIKQWRMPTMLMTYMVVSPSHHTEFVMVLKGRKRIYLNVVCVLNGKRWLYIDAVYMFGKRVKYLKISYFFRKYVQIKNFSLCIA